jgi:4-amino-4-deoxy-L-arabinose transferase-like glycosyltransferase
MRGSALPRKPTPFERDVIRVVGVAILCLVHGWLVIDTLRRKSPTVDEIAHLPAGESFLEKRDFRMYHHNPPLARALAALAADLPIDTERSLSWTRRPANHWGFAWDTLDVNADPDESRAQYLNAFTKGRTVIAVWSAATLAVVYWWAWWWFGETAAWGAALLYCVCPNIIAHAGVVTTDLPATATTLMACFAFARWLEGGTWTRAVVAGVLLGVALLTKFSALWLAILWPIWAILHPALSRGDVRGTARNLIPWRLTSSRGGRQFLGIVFYSWLTVNAGYLFQGRLIPAGSNYRYTWGWTPIGDFGFVSGTLTRERRQGDAWSKEDETHMTTHNEIRKTRVNRFRGTPIGRVPCMLPYEFVSGFDDQKWEAEGKYQMYFHGELRHGDPNKPGRQGWWYYYLAALGLKLPIGTLILIGLGIIGGILFGDVSLGRFLVILALAAAPILAMTLLSDINLGLRYVLPALPFLFIIGGSAMTSGRSRAWQSACAVLLLWNIGNVFRVHPHEMSYFNEFAGGMSNGRNWLIDSNLDWGQDLRGLARWLEKNPEWKSAKAAYWGSLPTWFETGKDWTPTPPPRGPENPDRPYYRLWPGENRDDEKTWGPKPGKYIVSGNFERGHGHHTSMPVPWIQSDEPGITSLAEPGTHNLLLRVPSGSFEYFRHLKPTIHPEVGYSILFYDVDLEEANHVRKLLHLKPLASP